MSLHDTTGIAITVTARDAAVVCDELRRLLEVVSRDLDAQIRDYPTPIPRCDAQFNHLYDLRGSAVRELAQLREAVADHSPDQVLRVIAQHVLGHAPYTQDDAERLLRDELQAWR